MRKSRVTAEQIIKVLKEPAAGLSAGELCRKYASSIVFVLHLRCYIYLCVRVVFQCGFD
jgi:hypothetical protein